MTLAEAHDPARYTPELADLMEHEKAIEQGISSMLHMASSYEAIKTGKKYRAAGHRTWEAYCRDRWALSVAYVDRIIDAARIVREIPPIGGISPQTESQVRPLKALTDAESRAEAWNEAVESAGGGQPTAKQVAEAVARRADPQPEPADLSEDEPAYMGGKRAEMFGDDQDDEDDYVRVEDIADVEPEPKPAPVRKKDLGGGIHHPARYSDNLIPKFAEILGVMFHDEAVDVLDPFGGTGRIHELDQWGHNTCAVEIEPEWANLHERTFLGSALDLPWVEPEWDAIVTSPTYGNRLADSHNASDADERRSYTHDLGRKLHADNSGAMQWGDRYRQFHVKAWTEALRVLKRNGLFILNIKDHIRNGRRQHVAGWHVTTLCRMGLTLLEHHEMSTKNLAVGANATERLNEQIYVFVKGEQ